MLKILCFEKNAYICNTDKPIKITVMKQSYKIIIFTTEGVLERKFYRKDIAISTIKKYKEYFDDFKIGFLLEKVEGDWNTLCSIKK